MKLPDDIAYHWLTYDAAQAAAWEALLSAEERKRLQSFGLAKRRREFVLGRAAARTLLAERLGAAPTEVVLRVANDGCVEALGCDISLSITHAGPHAVAAIARRPVGVDLETIQPRHPGLPRFLLHPDEHHLLDTLPFEQTHALILCWTLKEATLKGLRTGFRLSPKKLRLEIEAGDGIAFVHPDGGAAWQARFIERAGHFLAIAYAGDTAGEEKPSKPEEDRGNGVTGAVT